MSINYTFRSMLFRRRQTYEIHSDGLFGGPQGRGRLMAYRDIGSVRVYQVQSQFDGPIERCKLTAGSRTILLQSADITGPVRLKDQRTAYDAFLRALVPEIVRVSPNAVFLEGVTWWTKAGWVFTLVLAFGAILGGVTLLVAGEWSALWLCASAVTTIPLALTMVLKPTAQRIDPLKRWPAGHG